MGAVDLDRLVSFAAAALGAFGQDHAVAPEGILGVAKALESMRA